MTALDKKLVAKVVAARKKWAPQTPAHKEAHAELFLRGFGGVEWREFAQAQLGLARHAVGGGTWSNIPNGSIRKCIELAGADTNRGLWSAVAPRCVESFFDGYALASAAHGQRENARVFSSPQQLARFETQAMVGAPALVKALGPELDKLLVGRLAKIPKGSRDVAAESMRLSLVMGLLLHQHEFGWKHEWSEAVATAVTNRRAQVRAEPAPVHLPENEALLAAILSAPDDDGPRQVYADWLMERGDPRGEFITLQLKLGRTLSGAQGRYASATALKEAEVAQLKQRELELIKKYEKVWVPWPRCFRTWSWHRGFLSSVVADLAMFAGGVGSVSKFPLQSARLTGFKPTHVKLVQTADVHPTLRFFELSANRLNASTLAALVRAPLFSRARGLDLWGNDLSKPAAALSAVELPALERLSVCRAKLTDAGLAGLAEAPFFARLTHLDVSFNRAVTLDGLQALRKAKSLRWVNVLGTDVADRKRVLALLPRGVELRFADEDPVVDLLATG